jgi:hypothetical protein
VATKENLIEAVSALATLYNNLPPDGNGCVSCFLIVFTLRLLGAWKTGLVLWISGFWSVCLMAEVGGPAKSTGDFQTGKGGRDAGEEKRREIKKKESSTRRSGRKSGNRAEVAEREEVV